MVDVVLRVRLVSGDQVDVTYEEPDAVDDNQLIEHMLSTLAQDAGTLRRIHGGQLGGWRFLGGR